MLIEVTITAIKLLILRSFQRKGLCNSGLKHYLCTQYNNNTFKVTLCDIKNKDSNMADITEKTGNTLFTHLYGGRGEKKTGNVFR